MFELTSTCSAGRIGDTLLADGCMATGPSWTASLSGLFTYVAMRIVLSLAGSSVLLDDAGEVVCVEDCSGGGGGGRLLGGAKVRPY